MTFDIHSLNTNTDLLTEEDERALQVYEDELVELFVASPEAESLPADEGATIGFWARMLIHYGYLYTGVSLPEMETDDVEEVLFDVFPRKISLTEKAEAESSLPELEAFWRFLQRAFALANADAILTFLAKIDEDAYMNSFFEPANFGTAKSFVMAGQQAGFDMSDPDQIDAFMHLYNRSMIQNSEPLGLPPGGSSHKKQDKAKKKKKRKAARAARKRNRRK